MSDLVVVVVIVAVLFCLLVLLVNEFLKGCLRILKRLEPAWRAATKSVQERLAEGAREHQTQAAARERAGQQEEQASTSPPLVDAVMHGDPADKKPGSQNNLIVALGVIIVGLVIVILRSPSDPSAGYQGRDGAQIWVDSSSPDGMSDIVITGDIGSGDYEKFLKVIRNVPFGLAYVVLNSRGGDVSAGINIGMEIKKNDWGTAVLSGGECASSCVLIWLAGSPRAVQYRAKIGFHAIYYARNGAISPDGNAFVGGYMRDLGFGFDAIRYVTQTPPDQIEWLTEEKAKKYDIAVRFFGK